MEYHSNNQPNLLGARVENVIRGVSTMTQANILGSKVENVIKELNTLNQQPIPKYNVMSGGTTVSDKISNLLFTIYNSVIHPNLILIITIIIVALFLVYRYYAKATSKEKTQEKYTTVTFDIPNQPDVPIYDNSTIFTASEDIMDDNQNKREPVQYLHNNKREDDNSFLAYNEQDYYQPKGPTNNEPHSLLPLSKLGFEIEPPYST